MTNPLDKLNLRPGEKRLVVVVGVAAFLVLNYFFVWGHFGDVGTEQRLLLAARNKLATYEAETARIPVHQIKLRELEGAGQTVPTATAALTLQSTVQQQASQSGVAILSYDSRTASGGSGSKSSDFYDEYQLRITTNSGEKELVDFLFKLGANNSLIRVRDLTVQPDPSQTRLAGTIMLVASYQKEKPAGKKSVAAAKP